MFQFHEGPIKTSLVADSTHNYDGFNSMKVRLKPPRCSGKTKVSRFQFHEGPIKTTLAARDKTGLTMFQFHEGPIKTHH